MCRSVTAAEVRVVTRKGDPWFVLSDVCKVLDHSNPSVAAARLDDDERDALNITDPMGRPQQTTIINESGLYALVLTSRKPEAKAFKKWVTGTVLPSIRKNGGYIAGQEKLATGEMTDAELLSRSLVVAHRVLAERDARIAALAPKAAIVDEHMASFGRYSLSRFARTLDGINSNRIKADLLRHGYVHRVWGRSVLAFGCRNGQALSSLSLFRACLGTNGLISKLCTAFARPKLPKAAFKIV